MSRVQEKIKDLIEVHPYKSLKDFTAEPSETLSGYHFTDITSNLMVKWLDTLVSIDRIDGQAKALAGYRGVGKSHFLATFAAIISKPELRSTITDQHVSASAQHLMRKRYPVAFIRRGLQSTLLEEIRFGISNSLSIEEFEVPSDVESIVKMVSERFVETPFIIIVDTASDRESRVARDDGQILGDLASIAKKHNIFVGIALDDDISNADGINSSIAQNFTIDYLDQEHLYQIVNTHIFPKHRQTQAFLRQIYTEYKNTFPGFRWSEQRFNSIYPLHPSILEVAPFIRLYVQNFAVLEFAAEAGTKILGRPANSLIALDEIFDSVENSLRKSPELKDIFDTYDRITKEIVSQIPVMERLQAKLLLKAWFILSLNGDGTTASEVAATMLIFNERDPKKSLDDVKDLLEKVAAALPDQIWRRESENGDIRYSFKLKNKDSFNDKLEDSVESVDNGEIPHLLRRVAKEKFTDWHFPLENEAENADYADCLITWRGGIRRVRLWWDWENEISKIDRTNISANYCDLEIFITNKSQEIDFERTNTGKAVWQTAKLNAAEIITLKKLSVLLNNQHLREENPQQVNAAIHTGMLAVENIWNRIFISEAKLKIDDFEFEFPNDIGQSETLGGVFSLTLRPYFEERFPDHPVFEHLLTMNDVSILVNNLFSGAKVNHDNVQQLAENFALPLGLVSKRGENYLLESEDALLGLPLVKKVLSIVEVNSGKSINLDTIYEHLHNTSFGLVREMQNLILGALVAQRKIEFVTSKGDRINRRSLDLKILWDDIEGIAKSSSVQVDHAKLLKWIQLFTNDQTLASIDDKQILEVLKNWLDSWEDSNILARFNQLPDEILNTKVWYFAANIEKTFGSAAESIASILEESLSIEEGIQRIIDSFYESEEEFQKHSEELTSLKHFIEGADLREKIWAYLSVCESTKDEEIEHLRDRLFYLIGKGANSPNAEDNVAISEIWEKFHTNYSDLFALKHDMIMKSHLLQEKFDEILKSDQWWEFENLSKLQIFQTHFRRKTEKIFKLFNELDCRFDVRENLKSHPFCACSFNLAKIKDWENLPKHLISTIEQGRKSYRRTLFMLSDILVEKIETLANKTENRGYAEAATDLGEWFERNKVIPYFSINHINILNKILEDMTSSTLLDVRIPKLDGYQDNIELRENLNNWLDELPKEPVLVKI